jgi:hypothetical protein
VRVLAFTPTYGDALRPETVAGIVAQRWDGTLVWEVGRRNAYPPPDLRNVHGQYAWARERALAGGFDALWTVEHDMALPADALAKLAGTDAGVVYGVYMLRHGSHVLNAWQLTGGRNLGMSLSLYPQEVERARRAGQVEVSGVGFGCTLMRRAVLERITFRPDGEQAPDIPFATDCVRAGVRQVARFDVACGHVDEGRMLTVAEQAEGALFKALQTVTVGVQGVSRRLVAGESYTLDAADGRELVRAGYVQEVTAPHPASSSPDGEGEGAKAKRARKGT